jgi:GR25 family glycosyltransferase involved in LPS biosynthesis
MNSFMSYWDKVFCINLDRRTDRWEHAQKQMELYNIQAERFSGYDNVIVEGLRNGNAGCTASHRGVLEIIAHNKWDKVLILEDDFECNHSPSEFLELWNQMINEVPKDWDFLYLGGHYANPPQKRVSKHVIKMDRMLTTSSYAVRWQTAKAISPYLSGNSPIDSLISGFTSQMNAYIFHPRLMVQTPSFSDIQERDCNHTYCMRDTSHENMV